MGAAASAQMASLPDRLTFDQVKHFAGPDFTHQRFKLFADSDDKIPKSMVEYMMQYKYDVFLTHNWAEDQYGRRNHDRVAKVNQGLKECGLVTWFDDEKMQGKIVDQMCNGISESLVVAVFITHLYIEKVVGSNENDNCKLEFQFASMEKSTAGMVPVVMEDQMKNPRNWKGQVKMFLGGSLYVDMSKDEDLPAKVSELTQSIAQTIKNLANSALSEKPYSTTNTAAPPPPSGFSSTPKAFQSNKDHSSDADREVIESMGQWLKDEAELIPSSAMNYASMLVGDGVHRAERLAKRIQKKADYLTELGVDEEDAEDICAALRKKKLLSGNVSSSHHDGGSAVSDRSAALISELHGVTSVNTTLNFLNKVMSSDRQTMLTNKEVAAELFHTILRLCTSKTVTETFVNEAEFTTHLLAIMNAQFSSNPEIMEEGLLVIAKLCRFDSEPESMSETNITKLGSAGFCELVSQSLNAATIPSASCGLAALKALSYLATGNDRNKNALNATGACNLVAKILISFGDSSVMVVREGLGCIRNMSFKNDDIRTSFGDAGIPRLMIKLMKKHRSSEIIEFGLRAIQNLTSGNNKNCTAEFISVGAAEFVVSILNTECIESSVISEHACGSVRNLSFGEVKNRIAFGDAKACEAVVNVLKIHGEGSASVAKEGCIAITNLCSQCEVNKERVGKLGGVNLIMGLIKKHGETNSKVALEGLFAMKSLLFLSSLVPSIKSAGLASLNEKMKNKWEGTELEFTQLYGDIVKKLN